MDEVRTRHMAIQAHDLTKYYNGQCVVDHIELNILEGLLFGVLGPNGAGKSTTMRMIQGVTPADEGQLNVMGFNIPEHASQMRHKMGVVPQIDNLDPDFTIRENLLTYGQYFSIDAQTIERRIAELLEFVELEKYGNSHINALSGGMKRRLTFARALINNPDLVILDEPTTGLDPQVRHQIWDKLRELRQQGKTMILTTHYLEEAQRLCDELVIIDHGRILEHGKPRELISRLVEPEVVEIHDDERAIAVLEKIPGCRIESAGGSIYGYLTDAKRAIDLLHKQGIASLQRPANLEDVFLKLTGRGLRG